MPIVRDKTKAWGIFEVNVRLELFLVIAIKQSLYLRDWL